MGQGTLGVRATREANPIEVKGAPSITRLKDDLQKAESEKPNGGLARATRLTSCHMHRHPASSYGGRRGPASHGDVRWRVSDV